MSKMYRYENYQVSLGVDEWDRSYGSRTEIRLCEFEILKKTPKGTWIDYYYDKKFILDKSSKRYAWETKELAKISFIARKDQQIKILSKQLQNAQTAKILIMDKKYVK